jgi:regulator of ribonuclease activity A
VKILTSDLCDAHPELAVADPIFTSFGGEDSFFGQVVTLKVFEDNALVRTALEAPGEGKVLVVDGGGSRRCALVGGNLARLAASNGWRGIIVFGCVRDSAELRATAVGIKALAAHPRKSEKGLHSGQRHQSLSFAGVSFKDGNWVYGDADGIVVAERPVHVDSLDPSPR